MEEFITKLNYYFESAKPTKLSTLKHITRLPQIEATYGQVRPLRTFTDKFFNEIKFQYGSNISSKLNIIKTIEKSNKIFSVLKEVLQEPYSLQTIILEKHIDVIPPIEELKGQPRLLTIPSSFDESKYKKAVEEVDMSYYGKLIETYYVKLDFYSDTFNYEKAKLFLTIPLKKVYGIGISANVNYPPEKNYEFKNVLLQILRLKDTLLIGGIADTKMTLTSKVDDILILLSRIFGKVQFCLQIISFGKHGVKIYAKDFKGISDDLYHKLKNAIFKGEEDIISIFKLQNKLTNSEELSLKLDEKTNEIVEMYQQNKDLILKNLKQLDEARVQRTLDDVYQYFIQEE
jgi:hypothetical protein